MKSVARLYISFNRVTFITIENNNLGNRCSRYRIDANYLDGEAGFIARNWKVGMGRSPHTAYRVSNCLSRKRAQQQAC